mmetsp:Transcript_9397/g.13793  ORF Transcript_9397/g.13793 Transcript_9397/m.13793 type:complete len:203 (+) Transcript_9397:3-611(+)
MSGDGNRNRDNGIHNDQDNKSYKNEMFETCIYSNIISFFAEYTVQQAILCYGYYAYVKSVKSERRLRTLYLDDDDGKEASKGDQTDYDELLLHHEKKTNQFGLEHDLVETDDASDIDDDEDDSSMNTPTVEDRMELHAGILGGEGGILLSFLVKSSQLFVGRVIGLFTGGIGGAMGSMVRPGLGTLLGFTLGEKCASACLED